MYEFVEMKQLALAVGLMIACLGCESTLVEGRVLLPSGSPAAGTTVYVSSNGSVDTATTDDEGYFCFDISLGEFSPFVTIVEEGYAQWRVFLIGLVDAPSDHRTVPTLTLWKPDVRASEGTSFEWAAAPVPAGADYRYVLERNAAAGGYSGTLRDFGTNTRGVFDDRLIQDDPGDYDLTLLASTDTERFVSSARVTTEPRALVPVSRGKGCLGSGYPFPWEYENGEPLPRCMYTDGKLHAAGDPEEVLVDLEEPVVIEAVSISNLAHSAPEAFLLHVEVSDDRTVWQHYGSAVIGTTRYANGYGMVFSESEEDVSARYVRVLYDDASHEAAFGEVGVWAK